MYDELGGDDLLPGFVEAGTADDTFYAAPVLLRRPRGLLPQGLLRGRRRRGADDARRVRRGRHARCRRPTPAGRPTSPASGSPARTGTTAPPGSTRNGGDLAVQEDGEPGRGAVRAPSRSRASAEVQDLFTNATSAPRDADSNEPWVPFNDGESAMFSAPTWARWSIDLPQCNQGVDPEDESEEADGRSRRAAGLQRGADRRLPAARPGGGRSRPRFRRRVQHRHPGEVPAPGAGQEPAADHLQRGVPDDAGRERADPRATAEYADAAG